MPSPFQRQATFWFALGALVLLAACGDGAAQSDSGVTIGLVTNNSNGLRNIDGFRDGMAALGYVAGDNVTYLSAGEPVTGDDLTRQLETFVASQVDLIFTAGTPTGVAAHEITGGTGIPVVFGVIADPVAARVMEDIDQPGGNMTGVMLGQHQDRRLEILLEMLPRIGQVLVPYDPDNSAATSAVAQISAVAAGLGVELITLEARTDGDVTEILANLPAAIDAIFLPPGGAINARIADVVRVATELRLPVSGPSTAQVQDGALMTYGFIHEEAGAQAARIADQVLRGADPAGLPVEFTESFLAINLVAAEAIGVDVSDAILRQAEVIVRAGAPESGGG